MNDKLKGFQGGLILHFDELDSTQEFVLQNHESLQINTCVWTHQQKSGKGRRGRPWIQTPQKDLAFSVLFKLPMGTPTEFINQWFAFALREAIDHIFKIECDLKWPNDIKWKGQKVSGILSNEISLSHESDSPITDRIFAMGIGLNLLSCQEDRAGVDQGHISILEILNEVNLDSNLLSDAKKMKAKDLLLKYLSQILMQLSGVIYQMTRSPLSHFQHMISQFHIDCDRPISYILEADDTEHQAVLIGIEESGALIVKNSETDLLSILRNPWRIEY